MDEEQINKAIDVVLSENFEPDTPISKAAFKALLANFLVNQGRIATSLEKIASATRSE